MPRNGEGGWTFMGMLSALCAIAIPVMIGSVVVYSRPNPTKITLTSATVTTRSGPIVFGIDDLVRVTHKRERMSGNMTAAGLYRVSDITSAGSTSESSIVLIWFHDPRSPEKARSEWTCILEAESDFMDFVVYDESSPDYEAVMTEFKNISSADGEAVASKK